MGHLVYPTLRGTFSWSLDFNRCTFSYPNWVFVFMASVNYISRCHASFLNCVTCHDLYWGHWWETMPLMPFIWSNWFPVVAHLEPKSWYHQSPSHLPWDHFHLLRGNVSLYRRLLHVPIVLNWNFSLHQIKGQIIHKSWDFSNNLL